jgi:hypothetical protein
MKTTETALIELRALYETGGPSALIDATSGHTNHMWGARLWSAAMNEKYGMCGLHKHWMNEDGSPHGRSAREVPSDWPLHRRGARKHRWRVDVYRRHESPAWRAVALILVKRFQHCVSLGTIVTNQRAGPCHRRVASCRIVNPQLAGLTGCWASVARLLGMLGFAGDSPVSYPSASHA